MITFPTKDKYTFDDLQAVVAALRGEGGCPWDAAQTHESLKRCLLEESCEVIDAIDRGDRDALKEELGDLLLQAVFHADIEKENFSMDDICDAIVRKMLHRHPHVFGSAEKLDWEALKRQEKGQQTTAEAMEAVARALPATWRAEKIQKKAAADGFDFAHMQGALAKLKEEVGELETAVKENSNVAEELGDVLFAAVKVCRFAQIDPEIALNATSDKFIGRFRAMEEKISAQNRSLRHLSLDEMIDLWNNSKSDLL